MQFILEFFFDRLHAMRAELPGISRKGQRRQTAQTGPLWHGLVMALVLGTALRHGASHANLPSGSLPSPVGEIRREREHTLEQRRQLEATTTGPGIASEGRGSRLPLGEIPCFQIHRVVFQNAEETQQSGATLPSHERPQSYAWLAAELAGPEGDDSPLAQCIGSAGVQALLVRIQQALAHHGWVSDKVRSAPQDLASGTLVLSIAPGRFGVVRWQAGATEPDAGTVPVHTFNSVALSRGAHIRLADLAQTLENLERVPSAVVDLQLHATDDADGRNRSDLHLRYAQPNKVRFSTTLDDSGSMGTGKYQAGATLSLDNPLRLSDLLYFTLRHDLGGGDPGPRGTRGHTLHYSLPLGAWLVALSHSSSAYFQNVSGPDTAYLYTGTSENSEVGVSRFVFREGRRTSQVGLKAWQRKSNNYVDDTEVRVQRRAVGGGELSLKHQDHWASAALTSNWTYRRGGHDFGSQASPEDAFNEGTSQMGLLLWDVTAATPFTIGRQQMRYDAALRLQNNTTPLPPQDRFSIGGRYSVRGFDGAASLTGERGWTLRNDWGWALGASPHIAYLGLDAGEVSGPSATALVGSALSGGVLGVKGSFQHPRLTLQYDIFIGAPLAHPSGFRSAQTSAGFQLNLAFR